MPSGRCLSGGLTPLACPPPAAEESNAERCSHSAVFSLRKNSRETVRAAAPGCGGSTRCVLLRWLRLSIRGRNDRISEMRLRALQLIIETPDLLSGTQRTGKPYAR